METTADRRQRSATAWTGGTSKPLPVNAALHFAERRAYRDLLHAVQLHPELAKERDDFAMTPLHWLATDRDVPLRVLQHVVLAYPEATSARNLAGLLPLHMAMRKDLPLDALKTLLKFYPNTIVALTPDGKTPVEIATVYVSSTTSKSFLEMLDQEVRALVRVPPSQSSSTSTNSQRHQQNQQQYRKNESERTWSWHDDSIGSGSHRTLEERSYDGIRPLPPIWKLNKRCHLCATKFGYFKTRHHCRNCGESVCGRHSKHSVPLTHLGLFHPQRVCSDCYNKLQTHYTDRALARLSPYSNSPNVLGDNIMFEDTLPEDYASSPRQARSRSVFTGSSQAKQQQHPLLSPCHFEQSSPLVVTRAHRSATLSPSHRTISSSNVSSRSGASSATTATAVSQSNFLKTPSAISMHITHVQRTEQPTTVLQRQKEMQHRRDRLAKTDVEDQQDLQDTQEPWRRRGSDISEDNNQRSNNDHELHLEVQMEKLLIAKRKISDALKHSKHEVQQAQKQKHKYDQLARSYEEHGYPSPQSSPPGDDLVRVDSMPSDTTIEHRTDSRRASSNTGTAVNSTTLSEGNQDEHELEQGSPIVACVLYDDSEVGDVYGFVPDSTPRDTMASSVVATFQPDQVDFSLDLAATHHDLGLVLITKGDYTSAVTELQQSVDLDATNALAWYHFAKALDGKGESNAAEVAVHKSLAIEGNALPSLSLLGKLLNARGEHDEAIAVFRKALNLQCPSPRSSSLSE